MGVRSLAPLEQITVADVARVLATNVRGVCLASRAAAARMARGSRLAHHHDRDLRDTARARARRHAVRHEHVGADRADEGSP
ncbi:hypothetical protein [Streptomyces sp. ISL-10]|uniref:hypothetical protein n=1 Tax=Streptomyces sp. ISL-10 TaxID=2819172 RepID=UPI0027E544F1|nr:hypothetical protein [Streptomyces sp. ISL-10]